MIVADHLIYVDDQLMDQEHLSKRYRMTVAEEFSHLHRNHPWDISLVLSLRGALLVAVKLANMRRRSRANCWRICWCRRPGKPGWPKCLLASWLGEYTRKNSKITEFLLNQTHHLCDTLMQSIIASDP